MAIHVAGARWWRAGALALGLVLAGDGAVQAALLYELGGGAPLALTLGSGGGDHQVLGATVAGLTLGHVGGFVATARADVAATFTYLGAELGDRNSLFLPSPLLGFTEEQPGHAGPLAVAPVPIGTLLQDAAGPLAFGFGSDDGGVAPLEIWRNTDPGSAAAHVGVWFAGVGDDTVFFGLNDRGADRDWDDFVGRIDFAAVPLPGAAWLLGTALVSLAGLCRAGRRSRSGAL